MTPSVVRLSCDECRQRKTKCDKGNPCSTCRHFGTKCTTVQRARHPRGRSGNTKKKTVLETRVSQLEALVNQLGAQIESNDDSRAITNGTPAPILGVNASKSGFDESAPLPVPIKANASLAKEFFARLANEVAGIREVLDDSNEDDESIQDTIAAAQGGAELAFNPSPLIFGYQVVIAENNFLEPPAERVRAILLDIYNDRVDCLFKATYWPAAKTAIRRKYLGQENPALASRIQAVERSAYFMALCTMTEGECDAMLSETKSSLIQRYRQATEIAIARSEMLTNPDKLSLQSLVLYLMGLRVCSQYAASWTLLALAIRVGNALNLPPQESQVPLSFGDSLKLHVWYCIGMLDSQTSIDRGTRPMMTISDFQRKPSIISSDNTSDATFPHKIQNLPPEVLFSHVIHEATICSRKLDSLPLDIPGSWEIWIKKRQIVTEFETSIRQYCGAGLSDHSSHPFNRFLQFTVEDLVLNMQLLLRRPLLPCKHSPFPPWDDFDVLKVTTEIMERSLWKATDTTFAPWAWFSKTWLKWQVLAVLLAELCTPRYSDLGDRAYRIAQKGFDYCAALMAGTDLAAVLKPLERLMGKVNEVRSGMLSESQTVSAVDDNDAGDDITQFRNYSGQSPNLMHGDHSTFPISENVPWLAVSSHVDNETLQDHNIHIPAASTTINTDLENDVSWINWNEFLLEIGDSWTTTNINTVSDTDSF